MLAARQLPRTHPDIQPQEPPTWLSKADALHLPEAYRLAAARVRPLLDRVRRTAHGNMVLAVLKLTVSLTTIGKGLSNT